MATRAELVSQLKASLRQGLRLEDAKTVAHALEDELLVPRGLYLNGLLHHFGQDSERAPEIDGLIVRADGGDLSHLDVERVSDWLRANPAITSFSMGPLKAADSAEFMPIGSEEVDDAPSNE